VMCECVYINTTLVDRCMYDRFIVLIDYCKYYQRQAATSFFLSFFSLYAFSHFHSCLTCLALIFVCFR
jgi:hypothetical protein